MFAPLKMRVSSTRSGGCHRCGYTSAVLLRGVADNGPDNTAGQHDLEVVMLPAGFRHGRDDICEQQSNTETEQNTQRHRVHLFCKVSRGTASDHALDG